MPWFFGGLQKPDVITLSDPTLVPRVNHNMTSVTSLSQVADTSLFSFSGQGIIQAANIVFNKINVDIILKVDGVEVFRIPLDDIINTNRLNLASVPRFPFTGVTNKNQFILDFGSQPAGFATSFEFLARATGASVDKDFHLIVYREKT